MILTFAWLQGTYNCNLFSDVLSRSGQQSMFKQVNSSMYKCMLAETRTEDRRVQTKRIVMDLIASICGSGRNIMTMNTSRALSLQKNWKTTIWLSLAKSMKKVAEYLSWCCTQGNDRLVILFLISDNTLITYAPHRLRSVIILSTLQHQAEHETDEKSSVNAFYNKTKGGFDTNNNLAHTYPVRR